MYDLYKSFYDKYRSLYGAQTCIFLLVGSFYEVYDSQDRATGETDCNIKDIIDVLGLNVTIRKSDGRDGRDGLFAGVPDYSVHKHAGKLTQRGWTVVLVDQVRRADGSVKGREAARILSPATHTEVLGSSDTAFLVGILCREDKDPQAPPSYAATAFDLTTGITYTLPGQFKGRGSQWVSDELSHFFQVLAPREAIIWWDGSPLTAPTQEAMKQRMGTTANVPFHIRQWFADSHGTANSPLVREEWFRKVYNIRSMLPVRTYLGLRTQEEEWSLYDTLRFVEDHLPSSFERLEQNRQWCPRAQVRLGNSALTQLQMISQNMKESVLGLFDQCVTPLGKRNLRNRILNPTYDSAELEARYERVETHQALSEDIKKKFTTHLRSIYDIPRIHRRILTGQVGPQDVLSLHTSYLSAQGLCNLLAIAAPLLCEGIEKGTAHTLATALTSKFDMERAASASEDVCFLPQGKYPDIDSTEQQIQNIRAAVEKFRQDLAKQANLSVDALRMEPKEKNIYSIRCSKTIGDQLSKVIQTNTYLSDNYGAKAISMNVLKSGATVEGKWLDSHHEKTLTLRQRLTGQVGRIVPLLCESFTEETKALWGSLEQWVERLDIEQCIATVSEQRGFVRPSLLPADDSGGEAGEVHLKNLRHPLIETTLTRTEYVKHNVSLGSEGSRGWLIYGMNASGKSSLMKATGIAVLLAQAGAFVPASSCEIRPYKSIFTRILNQDNLWAGLSSFAVEMSEMREVLAHADKHTLVLGDELCSGTESASAHALVAAGIDWLSERGACYMFATHLHNLLQILPEPAGLQLKVWHLRVHYDRARDVLFYDRTLTPGPGSSLYGLEVARAMHVPLDYYEKALRYRNAFLGEESAETASRSTYNEHVSRRACEICGSTQGLEVHHIQQQSEAAPTGRFAHGSHKDDQRNLVTVCQLCHDKHHSGRLEIAPLKQTSAGPLRETTSTASSTSQEEAPSDPKPKTGRKSKWSDEQLTQIHEMLRKYPAGPLRRISLLLEQEHEIQITESSLRVIRSKTQPAT